MNFPLIFGGFLALFGASTLAHLLVVSVSCRRREIGILKALGFVRRQIGLVVVWQASVLAVIGIIVGIPLGVLIGRAVWQTFANNLGAVPVSETPIVIIGVLVGGVIIVANLIAVLPALVTARLNPEQLLRTQ